MNLNFELVLVALAFLIPILFVLFFVLLLVFSKKARKSINEFFAAFLGDPKERLTPSEKVVFDTVSCSSECLSSGFLSNLAKTLGTPSRVVISDKRIEAKLKSGKRSYSSSFFYDKKDVKLATSGTSYEITDLTIGFDDGTGDFIELTLSEPLTPPPFLLYPIKKVRFFHPKSKEILAYYQSLKSSW